jgi:hypothetical protein
MFQFNIWICSLNFFFGFNSLLLNSNVMNHLQFAVKWTPATQTRQFHPYTKIIKQSISPNKQHSKIIPAQKQQLHMYIALPCTSRYSVPSGSYSGGEWNVSISNWDYSCRMCVNRGLYTPEN